MPPADRSIPQPLAVCVHDGRRLIVLAADAAARALGIHPGMPLAHARALHPPLVSLPAEPEADAAALAGLAAWCLRYAPFSAADGPDGIWIDITGCAHLFGGETGLLADLRDRLSRAGLATRAAVADTPGAAWALARHGDAPVRVVPPGGQAAALAPLPLAALRLAPEVVRGLRRLGVTRVAELAAMPRAPLARRFGADTLARLDQAFGRVPEPIAPAAPAAAVAERLAFAGPILTAEAFEAAIARLLPPVCAALARAGEGARRLDLLFERTDGGTQVIGIGTARPVREAAHLARLFAGRIGLVDPGPGVEAMRLAVTLAEPMPPVQLAGGPGGHHVEGDAGTLVDVLVNRFGPARVYRCAPVESDVPERSVRRLSALAAPAGAGWPAGLPRPVRLLDPPQRVEAMSLLPDQPPVAFTWRRLRRRIRRADGPERIHGEWWRRDAETVAVRDYWVVEDEAGRRYWLFRRGDGADPASGDLSWFLHGLF